MAIVIPEGSGTASLLFSAAGVADQIATTIGFMDNSEGMDPGELAQGIYEAWRSGNAPFGAASMISGWSFIGVVVSMNRGGVDTAGQHMQVTAGTQTGQSLPVNCSFLVRKNTNIGGRRGRGRMYLPCSRAGEDQVNIAGVVDAGVVTALNTGMEEARVGMVSAGATPALLHEDGGPGYFITGFSTQSLLATQRRRMR